MAGETLKCPACGHEHVCANCNGPLQPMEFLFGEQPIGWMCPKCVQRYATPVEDAGKLDAALRVTPDLPQA